MGLGSHNCKGDKLGFEHNGVHKKDVEEDDKGKGENKGKGKDKSGKRGFHDGAGKHCPLDTRHLPNVHRKNKLETLPCGDGDVAAEEGHRNEKGERFHDALGAHHVSLENKPVAWLPSALFRPSSTVDLCLFVFWASD